MVVRLYNGLRMELLLLVRVKVFGQAGRYIGVMHSSGSLHHSLGNNGIQVRGIDLGLCCLKLAIRLPSLQHNVGAVWMVAPTLVALSQ